MIQTRRLGVQMMRHLASDVEDLVILTTPDGAKHFAEASKLPELPVLHSEEPHMVTQTYITY